MLIHQTKWGSEGKLSHMKISSKVGWNELRSGRFEVRFAEHRIAWCFYQRLGSFLERNLAGFEGLWELLLKFCCMFGHILSLDEQKLGRWNSKEYADCFVRVKLRFQRL